MKKQNMEVPMEEIQSEIFPEDDFTAEDFGPHWQEFLLTLKTQNNHAFVLLQHGDWSIDQKNSNLIKFIWESAAIKNEFEKEKIKFVPIIKKALNNFSIQIESFVNETKETKKYIKTRKEKFEDLIKINPNLELLRQKFNLDIEREP